MNLSAPLARALLLAASIGLTVPVLAQTPRPGTAPKKQETAEEEPKVIGVARAFRGGLLGLAVEGNAFVLRFYDAEKKPVPVTAARATARWDPLNASGLERTVLNPVPDGTALRSPTVVRPPHLFVTWITVISPEGEALGTVGFDMRELRQDQGAAQPQSNYR